MSGKFGPALHLGHLLACSDRCAGLAARRTRGGKAPVWSSCGLWLGAGGAGRGVEPAIANRQRRVADVAWDQARDRSAVGRRGWRGVGLVGAVVGGADTAQGRDAMNMGSGRAGWEQRESARQGQRRYYGPRSFPKRPATRHPNRPPRWIVRKKNYLPLHTIPLSSKDARVGAARGTWAQRGDQDHEQAS